MNPAAPARRELWGLLAEFATANDLLRAAGEVRDSGLSRWDAHTPFPVHGLDQQMGIRSTRIPWIVFGAGTTGCLGGTLMAWWMNAVDYPLIISGKPFFSLPANVPVIFELTILFSAVTAFVAMLVANGLPRLHHPLFADPGFRRATNDRFFISVEAADPAFDVEKTEQLLRAAGATRVQWIEG